MASALLKLTVIAWSLWAMWPEIQAHGHGWIVICVLSGLVALYAVDFVKAAIEKRLPW